MIIKSMRKNKMEESEMIFIGNNIDCKKYCCANCMYLIDKRFYYNECSIKNIQMSIYEQYCYKCSAHKKR